MPYPLALWRRTSLLSWACVCSARSRSGARRGRPRCRARSSEPSPLVSRSTPATSCPATSWSTRCGAKIHRRRCAPACRCTSRRSARRWSRSACPTCWSPGRPATSSTHPPTPSTSTASNASPHRPTPRTPTVSPTRALDLVHDALRLWRGPPLVGAAGAPFVHALTTRLDGLRIELIPVAAAASIATGRAGEVLPLVESMIAEHPYSESLWASAARLLYAQGRQADALDRLATVRRVLREELGLDPSPSTIELERQILHHDDTLRPGSTTPRRPTANDQTRSNFPPLRPLVGRDHLDRRHRPGDRRGPAGDARRPRRRRQDVLGNTRRLGGQSAGWRVLRRPHACLCRPGSIARLDRVDGHGCARRRLARSGRRRAERSRSTLRVRQLRARARAERRHHRTTGRVRRRQSDCHEPRTARHRGRGRDRRSGPVRGRRNGPVHPTRSGRCRWSHDRGSRHRRHPSHRRTGRRIAIGPRTRIATPPAALPGPDRRRAQQRPSTGRREPTITERSTRVDGQRRGLEL